MKESRRLGPKLGIKKTTLAHSRLTELMRLSPHRDPEHSEPLEKTLALGTSLEWRVEVRWVGQRRCVQSKDGSQVELAFCHPDPKRTSTLKHSCHPSQLTVEGHP